MAKDEVGTIEECLYSLGNRIEIAKLLYRMGMIKLLETELEDIVYSCQMIFEEYCIKENEKGIL